MTFNRLTRSCDGLHKPTRLLPQSLLHTIYLTHLIMHAHNGSERVAMRSPDRVNVLRRFSR